MNFNRVFHEINHPFWGGFPPIFGSTPIYIVIGSTNPRDISRDLENKLCFRSLGSKSQNLKTSMPVEIGPTHMVLNINKSPGFFLREKNTRFRNHQGFHASSSLRRIHHLRIFLRMLPQKRKGLFPRFCFSISSFISFFLFRAASWKGESAHGPVEWETQRWWWRLMVQSEMVTWYMEHYDSKKREKDGKSAVVIGNLQNQFWLSGHCM